MKVIEGSTRMAFLGYFLSHIPITLVVDSQGLFGSYYPTVLTDVVKWYCGMFGDILMKNASSTDCAWFSSLICCEILFQLPFFFVAIKFLWAGRRREKNAKIRKQRQHYPEWFRMTCIVYGTHVSTTLVPIIGTFLTSREMTIQQKGATIAIYTPYFIFPFWLMWLAVCEDFVGIGNSRKEANRSEETKVH